VLVCREKSRVHKAFAIYKLGISFMKSVEVLMLINSRGILYGYYMGDLDGVLYL
jgi:hypothetical protein